MKQAASGAATVCVSQRSRVCKPMQPCVYFGTLTMPDRRI